MLALMCRPETTGTGRWCSFDVAVAHQWAEAADHLANRCTNADIQQSFMQPRDSSGAVILPGGFRVFVVARECDVAGNWHLHDQPAWWARMNCS